MGGLLEIRPNDDKKGGMRNTTIRSLVSVAELDPPPPLRVMPAAAAAAAVVVPSLHLQRQRFSSPRKRILPRARSYGATRSGAVPSSFAAEGPSCLFVGPIETASKEMLEALYLQVRFSPNRRVFLRCSVFICKS